MSELREIGWYARQIAPHLPKEAFKPVPQRLWGGLVYLALGVGGILAISLLEIHWLGKLSISVLIGLAFSGLGFMGHEILHGTVVKSARLRDFLGTICMWQFNLGAKLWRKWHNMEHHANTQDDDHDPDAWATMDKLYHRPGLRWIYRLHPSFRAFFTFVSYTFFFSVHNVLILKKFYKDFRPHERPIVALQFIVPALSWFALLFFIGPVNWLFAYVLPLMIGNFTVISYISTNHQLNPLTDVNDPLANSLSVTVPRWVDILHFNFSYHTEHHLFPGMNPKWSLLVKSEVLKLWPEKYHEMPMSQALLALWRTPRIYMNQTELVDPHRMIAFGSLGHGLAPGRIVARKVEAHSQSEMVGFQIMKENPAQAD
jgi:fatty acid desaturase